MKWFDAHRRTLLRELVITDFKLRYQSSVLGYLWSLLKPMMLFSVLYVVFTKIFRLGAEIPYYPAYLLLGIVLWIFFVEATVTGMNAIVARGDLIRKVNMPKYIIVLATVLSALVNLAFNLVVVVVFMIITHVPWRVDMLFLPLVLAELLILALATAFLLSALFVRYRDFTHIWEVVLQVFFYGTPIIYPLSLVPHRLAQIISLNPLAQIIQDTRQILITPATLTPPEVMPRLVGWLVPPLLVMVLVVVAVTYFRRRAPSFAEDI